MKVGIITFYNGNINYGGMLQAYALQHAIEKMGHQALQVRLDNSIMKSMSHLEKVILLLKLNLKALDIWKRKKEQRKKESAIVDIRKIQRDGFKAFEDYIPHTEKIYTINDLSELDRTFDAFVCGSDQVWTPYSGGFRPVPHRWTYYLDFTKKYKLSYAASFGADRIPESFARDAMTRIAFLNAISVRENNAKQIILNYLNRDVEVVVDPVFLLSKEEWNNIAIEPDEDDYVLTYILGNKNNARSIALSISNKYGSKLYTIPFIGDYIESDRTFGDKQLVGIDPREFLGYVKKANYIVTDSFHCLAFSIIFEKKFVVVKRTADNTKGAMNSRVTDLLKTLNLSDRLNNDLETEMVEREINYVAVKDILREEVERSMAWIIKNMKNAEKENE